jgi:hypothetical protein
VNKAAAFSTAQAFTIRNIEGYNKQVPDGRPRIFYNTYAFNPGLLDYQSLEEVFAHEFIHIAGKDADTSFWASLPGRDDLSWYEHYKEIMAACK